MQSKRHHDPSSLPLFPLPPSPARIRPTLTYLLCGCPWWCEISYVKGGGGSGLLLLPQNIPLTSKDLWLGRAKRLLPHKWDVTFGGS